eukprot:scaffold647995_cov43-Prasinocladus_malaysianus.AAC.1
MYYNLSIAYIGCSHVPREVYCSGAVEPSVHHHKPNHRAGRVCGAAEPAGFQWSICSHQQVSEVPPLREWTRLVRLLCSGRCRHPGAPDNCLPHGNRRRQPAPHQTDRRGAVAQEAIANQLGAPTSGVDVEMTAAFPAESDKEVEMVADKLKKQEIDAEKLFGRQVTAKYGKMTLDPSAVKLIPAGG